MLMIEAVICIFQLVSNTDSVTFVLGLVSQKNVTELPTLAPQILKGRGFWKIQRRVGATNKTKNPKPVLALFKQLSFFKST